MLILSTTTDKISLVTTKAGNVHVVACFTDRDQTTGVVESSERQLSDIVTAATTDIVAAPGAATTRNIKSLNICNANTHGQAANGDNTVTVQFDANGTLYELHNARLSAGDILQYIEGIGFSTIANYVPMDRTFVKTADQIFNTAATFANIDDLSCDLTPGISGLSPTFEPGRRYNFLAHIYHISAAGTTGALFTVELGNTPDALQVCAIDCIAGTPNTAATMASGAVTVQDTSIIAETAGVTVIALCIISGYVIPDDVNPVGNPFTLRASAEVAANMTVKRGSWLHIWEQPRLE